MPDCVYDTRFFIEHFYSPDEAVREKTNREIFIPNCLYALEPLQPHPEMVGDLVERIERRHFPASPRKITGAVTQMGRWNRPRGRVACPP